MICYFIGRFVINQLVKRCARFPRARKIGLWAYESSYFVSCWMAALKLFMESYFDLAMCAAVAGYGMFQLPRGQDFSTLFNTKDDALASSLTIIYAFLTVVAPFIGYFIIIRNLPNL